jgi:uncharacterized SAM-binding protein YcdF (DUF218 family)
MPYQAINDVLQPYTVACLLVTGALVHVWRRRPDCHRSLVLVMVPFVSLVLLSLPVVSYLALGSLEWQFWPLRDLPDEVEAIVVLSGGAVPADARHPKAILADDSISRCLQAAELYRQRPGGCLIIATGGISDPAHRGPPLAALMRDFLIQVGVSATDVLTEERSTTTYENAAECARLLKDRKIPGIALVTEANHMRRAMACFAKVGLPVIPAPCDFKASQLEIRLGSFLPSSGGSAGFQEAFHEWLGLLWYWLHGRI